MSKNQTRGLSTFTTHSWLQRLLLACCLLSAPALQAVTIKVAVASNFTTAARSIAARFQQQSGHRVRLSFGSTGRHYAQIAHGAPFDIFLAADRERPQRLEAEGLAVAGSRFTYAFGRLALWSPQAGLLDDESHGLATPDKRRIAIANPKLAPYGRAARQVLERLGLWQSVQDRLVRGENIGQTYHFVHSGGAALGFVALSQLRQPGTPDGGSEWLPPAELYDPIEQQAVLLQDSDAARAFLDFLRSANGRAIIQAHGYRAP